MGNNSAKLKSMAHATALLESAVQKTRTKIVVHQDGGVGTVTSQDSSDPRYQSIYVKAFNTAIDTVLEREGHLFSPEEVSVINLYRTLPCESLPPSTPSNPR
jgi:hypothetical protein